MHSTEILTATKHPVFQDLLTDHVMVEAEMGFFEHYLGGNSGNLKIEGCSKNGCTRISHCSCNCNHNPCALIIL